MIKSISKPLNLTLASLLTFAALETGAFALGSIKVIMDEQTKAPARIAVKLTSGAKTIVDTVLTGDKHTLKIPADDFIKAGIGAKDDCDITVKILNTPSESIYRKTELNEHFLYNPNGPDITYAAKVTSQTAGLEAHAEEESAGFDGLLQRIPG